MVGLENLRPLTLVVQAGAEFARCVEVVTKSGGVGPCGACRQVLWEFRPADGAPVPVWIAGPDESIPVLETTLAQLLPGAFDERQL